MNITLPKQDSISGNSANPPEFLTTIVTAPHLPHLGGIEK
jgi:hypothetical protein